MVELAAFSATRARRITALVPLGFVYIPANALLFACRYADAVTELEAYVAAGEEPPGYMAFAYSKAGNHAKALEVVGSGKHSEYAPWPTTSPSAIAPPSSAGWIPCTPTESSGPSTSDAARIIGT